MPVIIRVPQDPTDLVLQGEQMRSSALGQPVDVFPPACTIVEPAVNNAPIVAGAQQFFPMLDHYFVPTEDVFADATSPLVRTNGVICSPCGAMIEIPFGVTLMQPTPQSTVQWVISGITRARSGFPLGFCEITVMEVGRIKQEADPVVAQTVSDANGAFSVSVPMNVAYVVMAYKSGSPDTGGVSIRTVMPTAAG